MEQVLDIYELQDVKDLLNEAPKRIRLIFLVYSIVVKQNEPDLLELTDFTSPYKKPITTFRIDSEHSACSDIKVLKKSYGIGKYLEYGRIVFVLADVVLANVSSNFEFVATKVEIVNTVEDLRDLEGPDELNIRKLKSLIQKLKIKGYWNNIKNKEDVDLISEKISQFEQQSVSKNNVSESSNLLNVNPLFTGPSKIFSQIRYQSQFVLPDDSWIPDNSELIEVSDDDSDNDDDEKKKHSQEDKALSIKRDTVDKTSDDIPGEDSLDIELRNPSLRVDSSTPSKMANVKQEGEDNEEVIESEEEEEEEDTDTESQKSRTTRERKALESKGYEQPEQQNEREEMYAIEKLLPFCQFDTDTTINFTGYIVGVDPANVIPFGQSFNSLPCTTNFRILISNVPPTKNTVFELNRNCLALDFKSKVQIMNFFGYHMFDSLLEEKQKNVEKLKKLTSAKQKELIDFKITRKRIGVTLGSQLIWECENGIDDFLRHFE